MTLLLPILLIVYVVVGAGLIDWYVEILHPVLRTRLCRLWDEGSRSTAVMLAAITCLYFIVMICIWPLVGIYLFISPSQRKP